MSIVDECKEDTFKRKRTGLVRGMRCPGPELLGEG